MNTNNNHIKHLSFPVYFWSFVVLLLAGISDSAYLSVHHYLIYSGNNRGVKPEHASRLVFLFCNYAVSVVSIFHLWAVTKEPVLFLILSLRLLMPVTASKCSSYF